jgi:hypothetical protein
MSFIGSPYGHQDVVVTGNTVHDFGRNAGPFGHWAFFIELSGSSTQPVAPAYHLDGLTISGNTISLPAPLKDFHQYYLAWDPLSQVRRLELGPNAVVNVPNVKAGPQAGEVTVQE